MSESKADIGYGITLEIALADTPETFVYIEEVYDATPPSDTDDQVDVTHMQSPNRTREFVAGLTDPGEASFEMNYVAGSATDRFLTSIKGKRLINRLTFQSGAQCIFRGSRQSYEKAIPVDDKMTATLGLKVSGEPILTNPAAPRNLRLPLITGIAKVGVPLTLDTGVWAGSTNLTYQWKSGGTDIADATQSSYVPVAGDVGETITVEVTAVNPSFDTAVTTAATAAVAA